MMTRTAGWFSLFFLLFFVISCSGGRDGSDTIQDGLTPPLIPVESTDNPSLPGDSHGGDPGGGNSDDPAPAPLGVTGGMAIDPYIVGATFFEDLNGNGRWDEGEQISTFSDEQGRFSFAAPVGAGRAMVMLDRGYHQGQPFTGRLVRRVEEGDSGVVVVTPLTTLAARGFTDSEISSLLRDLNGYREDYDYNVDPVQAVAGISDATNVDEQAIAGMRANLFLGAALELAALDNGTEESSLGDLLNYWGPLGELKSGLSQAVSMEALSSISATILPAGYGSLPPLTMREVADATPAVLNWWKNELVGQAIAAEEISLSSQEFLAKLDVVQAELTLGYYLRNNQDHPEVQAAIAFGLLPAVPENHLVLTNNGAIGVVAQIRQEDLAGRALAVGKEGRLSFFLDSDGNPGTTELTSLNGSGSPETVSGLWRIEDNILVLSEQGSAGTLRMELETDWHSHLALRVVGESRDSYAPASFIGRLLSENSQFKVAEI